MNRRLIVLCMASCLAFHTSCHDSVTDLESPNVNVATRALGQRIRHLIQQARKGDIEAYNSLALCYRDGDGVDKSWFNMMCMYVNYSQKTGKEIEDVVELFEEGHPFRLLFEIMDSPSLDEKMEAKLEQLKQIAPAEAKAIEAAKNVLPKEGAETAMCLMREAEDEGSELAVALQVIYYDEAEDKTGQEEFLTRIAEKYPFFNLRLGDVYVKNTKTTKTFPMFGKLWDITIRRMHTVCLSLNMPNPCWICMITSDRKDCLNMTNRK